ncbi:thymidylate kinase [Candidatus Mycoplasma haematolamae str. Purdue]|uniref:Thymidylate kinase n=1 Tax=Mycoplasma haematolamae (strain Purdue) TaxID=1212765 RepID=I7CH04_MYCHA|nr:dTMP kinase [Candidatus Mycoplasma haematolamae]AFO52436.1 thymidylate kinase [Candidatus Mycoplasma haematolamae str. Purdue]
MKVPNKGCFIVLEGIDSSGKTTILEEIQKTLIEERDSLIGRTFKEKIYFTSEPYGPQEDLRVCKEISNLLFSKEYELNPSTESLLFLASRSEHLSAYIGPKLSKGAIVFCDRFFLSTLAYQGFLRGINRDFLFLCMNHIDLGIAPTVTFLIEVSEEEWTSNAWRKEDSKKNKFDSLSYSFEELTNAYDTASNLLRDNGQRVLIVSKDLTLKEKAGYVLKQVELLLDE